MSLCKYIKTCTRCEREKRTISFTLSVARLRSGKIMFARVLLLVLCALLSGSLAYETFYDGTFEVECEETKFLSSVYSRHSNHYEDRRFSLQCRELPITRPTQPQCAWTDWVNSYDQPFVFACSNSSYVAGLKSEHSNRREDRIFKFNCCNFPVYHMVDCAHSSWVNSYDDIFNFTVPDGKVMRGMASVHSSRSEDRIFSFEYCSLVYIHPSRILFK